MFRRSFHDSRRLLGLGLLLGAASACGADRLGIVTDQSVQSSEFPGETIARVVLPLLGVGDINRVQAEVTATSFEDPRTVEMPVRFGLWQKTLTDIRPGRLESIRAQAKDTTGAVRFESTASDVKIAEAQLGLVVLAPTPIEAFGTDNNRLPWVHALTVSTATIAPGGDVQMRGVVGDPDQSALDLKFEWRADGGSFLGSTAGTIVTWRAPSVSGLYRVSLTATDNKDAAMTLGTLIQVGPTRPEKENTRARADIRLQGLWDNVPGLKR